MCVRSHTRSLPERNTSDCYRSEPAVLTRGQGIPFVPLDATSCFWKGESEAMRQQANPNVLCVMRLNDPVHCVYEASCLNLLQVCSLSRTCSSSLSEESQSSSWRSLSDSSWRPAASTCGTSLRCLKVQFTPTRLLSACLWSISSRLKLISIDTLMWHWALWGCFEWQLWVFCVGVLKPHSSIIFSCEQVWGVWVGAVICKH